MRIDAVAGRPAQVARVPYRGARPLAAVRATMDELVARRDELVAAGWFKVIVQLAAPDPDLSRKVRALYDNAVAIDSECPAADEEVAVAPTLRDAAPAEVYRACSARQHGRPSTTRSSRRSTT